MKTRSQSWFLNRNHSCLAAVLLFGLVGPRLATAEQAAYKLREGQKFGYEINAEADRGTHIDRLSGALIYSVKSVSDGQITLNWTSQMRLQESARAGGRGKAGARPAFAGLPSGGEHSGTLQMNASGAVISTKGAAHLPYLLGDAALLMIEALPKDGPDEWSVDDSVSLTETGQRQPGPPRNSQDATRTRNAANENVTYKVGKRDASELMIEKRYSLQTVEQASGKPRIEVNGEGNWRFDLQRQIPKQLNYQQTVVARAADRTSVEIPVTVNCRPLSDDEIKNIETEREQRWALAQEKLKERKENRSQPLDDETRRALLAELQSGNAQKMQQALQKLANRPAVKDDAAIAAAIKSLLTHQNMGVRHAAADAWAKYSTEAK